MRALAFVAFQTRSTTGFRGKAPPTAKITIKAQIHNVSSSIPPSIELQTPHK